MVVKNYECPLASDLDFVSSNRGHIDTSSRQMRLRIAFLALELHRMPINFIYINPAGMTY